MTAPAPSPAPAPRGGRSGGSRIHASFDLSRLPPSLQILVSTLEEWAEANRRDARNDTVRYWVFKVPVIVSSASAGVLALTGNATVAAIAAGLASACALIDAVNPGGALRNAHLQALHDLRALQHQVYWDWEELQYQNLTDEEVNRKVGEILGRGRQRMALIGEQLKLAETRFAAPETKSFM
ncbi:hypothetical protein [Deinococcus planocerae]|uniref:hypothetical protein n=1 Tax=Deinococcus planocerae TaxID=1737569 RepID=UPI0011AEFAA0|nr:hypothetical protein [Deinococcus planocerae]